MAAIHAVIGVEVFDYRSDHLAPFEQAAFFIGQPLIFTQVIDLNVLFVKDAATKPIHIASGLTYSPCIRIELAGIGVTPSQYHSSWLLFA
jgi:hypothetical protein